MEMQYAENNPVILVIEDEPATRMLLQDIFVEEGYEVLLAEDGAQAMTLLSAIQPELVTLDLNLPDIHGTRLLLLLRQDMQLHEVKVVLISAEETIPASSRALVHAVVPKPFAIDTLLGVVQQLLAA